MPNDPNGNVGVSSGTLARQLEQLAERFDAAWQTGKRPRIEYRPMHPADVLTTWADVSRARDLLDWRPTVGIEEGLARSVEWYKENRDVALQLELLDRNE